MRFVASSFRLCLVVAACAATLSPTAFAADPQAPLPPQADRLAQLKKLGARLTFDDAEHVVGINLSERRVADDDLAILAHFPHVEEHDLTRTRIKGPGLQAIRNCSRLKKLYLTETQIGDQAVGELGGLKSLEFLGLSGTKITDASLAHLAKLPKLKQLFCLGTKLSPAAIETFQKALPNCEITGP